MDLQLVQFLTWQIKLESYFLFCVCLFLQKRKEKEEDKKC